MGRRVPYRVELSGNKHSRASFQGETIVIRLAKNLNRSQRQEHVDELLKKMSKHAATELSKNRIDPFASLLKGEPHVTVSLAGSRTYDCTIRSGARTHVKATPSGWEVVIGPSIGRKALHRLLWKTLSEAEREYMESKVRLIDAATLNVKPTSVRLGHASSQWGSCAVSGAIMLNTCLLFLPEDLQEYVIVHELAHRIHHNHSRAFWKTVEKFLPDMEERKRRMKHYRLPSI